MLSVDERAQLLLEHMKEAGNIYYKTNDLWRAIAAYEAALAVLNLDMAHLKPKTGMKAYWLISEDIISSLGSRSCVLAVILYLNIAQAYLQLTNSSSAQPLQIDSVMAGHAVITVSFWAAVGFLNDPANKHQPLCAKPFKGLRA